MLLERADQSTHNVKILMAQTAQRLLNQKQLTAAERRTLNFINTRLNGKPAPQGWRAKARERELQMATYGF